jgi:tetratricopeptide (TPR) repeat protein
MEKRDIEIRRNIIEKSLMAVKDYARQNMKMVLYAAAALAVAAVLAIGAILYYDRRETAEMVKLERILDSYRKSYSSDAAERAKTLEQTVKDLDALTSDSWWGYVHRNGHYIIGGLYYNERNYAGARKHFLIFADGNRRSFFAPLALQQAARSAEYVSDYKEALKIYVRLEKDYSESAVADQVFYDLGRVYEHEGDIFKARENLNKVITSFPRSPFAQKAREKLMLLGMAGNRS